MTEIVETIMFSSRNRRKLTSSMRKKIAELAWSSFRIRKIKTAYLYQDDTWYANQDGISIVANLLPSADSEGEVFLVVRIVDDAKYALRSSALEDKDVREKAELLEVK